MKMPRWLVYSIITAVLWGVWGAVSDYPAKYIQPPFPTTLIYVINALTIIPVAIISLKKINWRPVHTWKAIGYGLAAGFTGAGGQLLLFVALKSGPPYLIFPIISLSPAITVIMSFILLKEKTGTKGKIGILLALVAIFLMSVQPKSDAGPAGNLIWLWLAIIIFALWGVQAYIIKASTKSMDEDSMFFYLAITLQIIIPFALMLTDFSQPINWGFRGPYLSIFIQLLNTVGVLFFVYSFKEGKAIIVAPIINGLYPVITIIISLLIYWQLPILANGLGMIIAITAIVMISYDEGKHSSGPQTEIKESNTP
jgi:drug/metabolite transporter (DMT)-like permease